MVNCVYIHIPFCQKKCFYCSFASFALDTGRTKEIIQAYLSSLTKEIKHYYSNEPLETLYFGGGTPSLLDIGDFEKLLKLFNFSDSAEITLEINPNTLNLKKLKDLKSLGINRISAGVQNYDDKILKSIGRNHTKKQIFNCINDIKTSGFDNFSLDLIYGLPSQNLQQWQETLDITLKLAPAHISLYGLKIEKGAYFYKFLPENLPDSDTQAIMYEKALEKLNQNYLHYEFSSFAKLSSGKNYISKHNTSYWKRKDYWGFGLSASGFVDEKRYTNTFNFKKYLNDPLEKTFKTLSIDEQIEEEIFLGLRLREGLDFEKINKKYNTDILKKYSRLFKKFSALGYMEFTKNGIKFSKKGILISNEILCEFIEI